MSVDPRASRLALNREWHARPASSFPPPFRCTHVVELRQHGTLEDSRDAFATFCREVGEAGPAEAAQHHSIQAGSCYVKWENHTEASSHTLFVSGNAQPPFSTPAIDFLDDGRREQLEKRMFAGVQVEVVRAPGGEDPHGHALARSLLGARTVYGGYMSKRTAAVWSAFTLDARGYARILIVALEDNEERISRLLQRLLDIETYRMLAMLALPKAREVMSTLGGLEPELDEVMRGLVERRDAANQEQALARITSVAAKVEHIAAAETYRFAAARAYAAIVERRCGEVDEEVLGDHQRYTNFLLRSFTPAMRTSDAAEDRLQELASRVGRAASLLDTMVEVVNRQQNQAILESLDRSARLQVRLQQAVEGFSIVAISYYGVGLLGYCLKAARSAGVPVNVDLATGLAAPLVLAAVWLTVRSVKWRLLAR